jgi:hypothetical protein
MTKPASYFGQATVQKKVADFQTAFNPLRWPAKAPYLWANTYLIPPVDPPDPGVGPEPVGAGPEGGTDPATGLPRIRSRDPARAPDRTSWDGAKLFEAAVFGGSLYRNVLQTSLVNTPSKISFEYSQVECLDTQSGRSFDGGIDIDFGQGSATQAGATEVQVAVSKTVRFTQPAPSVRDVNLLAHVMVPLSFDFWLHCGLFAEGE